MSDRTVGGRNASTAAAGRRVVVALAACIACAGVVASVLVTRLAETEPGPRMSDAGPMHAGPMLASPGAALSPPASATTAPPAEIQEKVAAAIRQAEQLDQTVFAPELEAQRHEEYFIRLWDDFRAAQDKFAVLESATFASLSYDTSGTTTSHDWDVSISRYDGAPRSLGPGEAREMISSLRAQGYRPTELEFHQSAFEREPGGPARSTVATVIHLVNEPRASRHILRAKLLVEWSPQPDKPGDDGMFVPLEIEATDLTVASRTGPPAFEAVSLPGAGGRGGQGTALYMAGENSGFVLAYDLDSDGLSEILLPGENLLLRNRGDWRFERERILPQGAGLDAAIVADFDGDGLPDLLCTRADKLFLARGVAGGRFGMDAPQLAADFNCALVAVLTAGDIDADGDLDVWLGQYKGPYAGGQMPTPYYDANDGDPAALLLNDGTGRFADVTESAGLAPKRFRRTLAGSLVDLDGDRDLDLFVNSDFSGLDVYYNDGKGKFSDVTEQVIDERHNFGMGHTFADFNLDGLLDVYTIGMSSTTARRLTSMGLGREEFPEHQQKRPQMGYGNRMFLAGPRGDSPSQAPVPFVQPAFKHDVARTGWSWGTSAPDFDNDGDLDIYVANGFKSGDTCRDYCTAYWRRDIYLGSSKEDPVIDGLFREIGPSGDISWNGFEHNVLLMNEGGQGFLNVAHLMGAAFEFDSRNVISDDLDGDGRMDLLVLERRLPRGRYLHMLRNNWPTGHNWIGARLAESRPGFSPIGAEVRVRAGGRIYAGRVVTGDSIHSQHATARHFGLGEQDGVESIEVVWPNGQTTRLDKPAMNRWHDVRPTSAAAAPPPTDTPSGPHPHPGAQGQASRASDARLDL